MHPARVKLSVESLSFVAVGAVAVIGKNVRPEAERLKASVRFGGMRWSITMFLSLAPLDVGDC